MKVDCVEYKQRERTLIINIYTYLAQISSMSFAKYYQKTGTKSIKGGSEKRKLWDNIHGFIYFDQIIWMFIDTGMFQRLRNIKQLGCLEYVFPGATHTRFQHCIGTAHLAQQFIKHLIDNHPEEYPTKQIQKEALLTCTLAGLVHDLGHGPYSHTFDSQIVTEINREGKIQKWSHQIASVELFKHMNQLQHLKGKLTNDQIERIITLIMGKVPKGAQRQWQYQLISNSINGIDVDKLDYFRRDAFYLGAKNIYIDHQLLMNQARIIKHSFIEKNEAVTRKVIAYPTKYVQTVYNIFHSRYKLYKIYYFNIKSTGIEQMISDVLKLVRDRFKIQRSCELIFNEPSHYLGLNDSILEKVFYEYERILEKKQDEIYIRAMQALNQFRLQQNSKQKDPILSQTLKIMEEFYQRSQLQYQKNFKEATQILTRIKKRDIYKFVKELTYQVKQNEILHADSIFKKQFKKQKIIEKISELGKIDPNQICVTIHYVSFGMKDANPLRKVSFFKKEEQQAFGRKIVSQEEAETLSLLFTNAFIESSIKVYIKRDDPNLFLQVDEAFEKFRIFFQSHLPMAKGMGGRTPIKQKDEEKPSQEKETAQDLVIQRPN